MLDVTAVALFQARGVNCRVLDEPTNHLDLPDSEGEVFFGCDPNEHYVSTLVGPDPQKPTMAPLVDIA